MDYLYHIISAYFLFSLSTYQACVKNDISRYLRLGLKENYYLPYLNWIFTLFLIYSVQKEDEKLSSNLILNKSIKNVFEFLVEEIEDNFSKGGGDLAIVFNSRVISSFFEMIPTIILNKGRLMAKVYFESKGFKVNLPEYDPWSAYDVIIEVKKNRQIN